MKSLHILILLFAFLSLSCSDDEKEQVEEQQIELPEIKNETTNSEAVVTLTTVEISGSVEDNGESLNSYGVVWSTDPEPTVNDNIVEASTDAETQAQLYKSISSSNTFTVIIEGLDPGANYYFRIYAQNEAGVAYGEELSLETLSIAGTKWKFHFVHSNSGTSGEEVEWYADVEFYEDGTAFYTEPDYDDMYDENGFYNLEGNMLTYNLTGNPDFKEYILDGIIEGNSISGTYWNGDEEFTAEMYE